MKTTRLTGCASSKRQTFSTIAMFCRKASRVSPNCRLIAAANTKVLSGVRKGRSREACSGLVRSISGKERPITSQFADFEIRRSKCDPIKPECPRMTIFFGFVIMSQSPGLLAIEFSLTRTVYIAIVWPCQHTGQIDTAPWVDTRYAQPHHSWKR